METLYGRLFRYKSRPDREPLEDFLSEALADLLERMPREETDAFLYHAIDLVSGSTFSANLARQSLEWQTQVSVPGGIIDIGMFADGEPKLIIENKTWSGFQDHSTTELDANQLHTYCNWLASKSVKPDHCAILLITGTTAAPPGFHGDGSYAIRTRAQITWADVGRWLRARTASPDNTGATWRDLAVDLIDFLKEKKLSSEIFTASDLSAAHIMLPTMDRWTATFQSMWQGSSQIWDDFLNPRVSDLSFSTDAGMLWHWRYGKQLVTPNRAWVGLGLRFPDHSQWYEGLALPNQPHFLFILGTDEGELKCPVSMRPGWIRDPEDGQIVLARAIDTFSSSPDVRIEQLHSWAKSAMTDAKAIFAACSTG